MGSGHLRSRSRKCEKKTSLGDIGEKRWLFSFEGYTRWALYVCGRPACWWTIDAQTHRAVCVYVTAKRYELSFTYQPTANTSKLIRFNFMCFELKMNQRKKKAESIERASHNTLINAGRVLTIMKFKFNIFFCVCSVIIHLFSIYSYRFKRHTRIRIERNNKNRKNTVLFIGAHTFFIFFRCPSHHRSSTYNERVPSRHVSVKLSWCAENNCKSIEIISLNWIWFDWVVNCLTTYRKLQAVD